MAEVVWTVEALDDIEAVGVFHERTSPSYAASIVQHLYHSVEILEIHPSIGRKVPEIDHESVRELLVDGYRVVYQLMNDRIEILAVLHGRQDLIRKFRERRRGS